MTEFVLRRYTFKLYPNAAQQASLERQCQLHAWLWNAALQERIDCYRLTGKSLNYYDQAKHVKTVRADDPEYAALSADSLALTLKRLDLAFQAFFRRAKAGAGAESGFPRYRAADRYDTIPFRDAPKGWRLTAKGGLNWTIYAKGTPGEVRARGKFPAEPEALRDMTIVRRDGAWWMSVVVRIAPRRTAGVEVLRVSFDLIDEFARVERVNGECLPAVSLIAGNGNQSANQEVGAASAVDASESRVDGRVMEREAVRKLAVAGSAQVAETTIYNNSFAGAQPANGGCAADAFSDAASVKSTNVSGTYGAIPGGRPEIEVAPQAHEAAATGANAGGRPGIEVAAQDGVRHGAEKGTGGRNGPVVDTQGSIDRTDDIQSERDRRYKRGSKRWLREKRRIAKMRAATARRQREALHRWSTSIVRIASSIEAIAPEIKPATQTARGDERNHGAAVETIAALNRHILSQAPAAALQMLEYKAAEAGIPFARVTPSEHKVAIGRDLPAAAKAARRAQRITRKEAA